MINTISKTICELFYRHISCSNIELSPENRGENPRKRIRSSSLYLN